MTRKTEGICNVDASGVGVKWTTGKKKLVGDVGIKMA
jgi:hypothetical protein